MEKPNPIPAPGCGSMTGSLPNGCGALVFPYIPMQEPNPPRFSRTEALQTGTLFPGLDLPFKAAIQAHTQLNLLAKNLTSIWIPMPMIRRSSSSIGPISNWPRRAGRNMRKCAGPLPLPI